VAHFSIAPSHLERTRWWVLNSYSTTVQS